MKWADLTSDEQTGLDKVIPKGMIAAILFLRPRVTMSDAMGITHRRREELGLAPSHQAPTLEKLRHKLEEGLGDASVTWGAGRKQQRRQNDIYYKRAWGLIRRGRFRFHGDKGAAALELARRGVRGRWICHRFPRAHNAKVARQRAATKEKRFG